MTDHIDDITNMVAAMAKATTPAHLAYRYDMTQPCRAKSQKCGAAGECTRCSADQGVACGDNDPFIDPSKTGMFRDHSCTRCNDGAKPCPNGQTGPSRNCEHPRARND